MKSLPRLSVENPILVNLLMLMIIGGGIYACMTLVKEMFPESRPNQVMIMTPYPGASPAEVEKGISLKIEEQIKDIEGVDKIETTINEGISQIAVTLYQDVDDLDRVVNDIKNAIDAIPRSDSPEEAEETIVSRFEPKLQVIMASLYGDMTDEQLKAMGKQLRDDILALPGITDVVLSGTRNDEISVEVRPDQLIRYNLSFAEIAETIRRGNMDLPGGQVKTADANVAVRTLGEKDTGDDLQDLVVRAEPDGQLIRLSDVATVVDGFEDVDVYSRIDGKPGVTVTVFKTPTQDAIDIARKVKALVAGKNREPFESDWMLRLTGQEGELREIYEQAYANPYPAIGKLKTHSNLSRFIEGRLELLTRNGLWGLVFVFASLLAFLNWRVALWVMMGLVLAICGTLVAMQLTGITLNLITMFGLIVVLGMLVDDAIIVGEHTYTKIEEGVEPELAAISGAEEVTSPVTCAIATTIVAFIPLLFIEGRMGDFMGVLPVIVILSLSISLFEALSILPSHLAESFIKAARNAHRRATNPTGLVNAWNRHVRGAQVMLTERIVRGSYARFLRLAISYRYVTVSVAVATLIVTIGVLGGGIVDVVFLQKMDSETLIAEMELPVGAPIERTDRAISVVEKVSNSVPEMESCFTLVGGAVSFDMNAGSGSSSSHVAQLIMELSPIEERDRPSDDILQELRTKTGPMPGVNTLTFSGLHGGPGGAPIEIDVAGEQLDELVTVTGLLKDKLREFDGVFDIEDDFDAGQREIQLELLDSARALGLNTDSLAMEIRAAFYGWEARKIQRDREDVKIMVRYPEAHRRRIEDLEQMRIATPHGELVPLSEVARIKEGAGFATIRRQDQERCVTVRADVNESVANPQRVIEELQPTLTELRDHYPGVSFKYGGDMEERMKAFSSLQRDALIAVALIYVILAGLFKSYIQPLIVMMAIPFGIIGAVAGHYVMGYPMTVLSFIGLVALTGIVVNDSLILVDFINRRVAENVPLHEAVIQGGIARIRAIILTSVTTILGLAPLLLEKSFQARFLIPMGISIAFGLAFATVLTLVVVPCLYLIVHDARSAARAVRRFLWPPAPEPTT